MISVKVTVAVLLEFSCRTPEQLIGSSQFTLTNPGVIIGCDISGHLPGQQHHGHRPSLLHYCQDQQAQHGQGGQGELA